MADVILHLLQCGPPGAPIICKAAVRLSKTQLGIATLPVHVIGVLALVTNIFCSGNAFIVLLKYQW